MSCLTQPSYWNGGIYHALSLFVKLFTKSFFPSPCLSPMTPISPPIALQRLSQPIRSEPVSM